MTTTINETTTPATTDLYSALPEKTIQWITREAAKAGDDAPQRIIELTCQHIASQQNRKKTPFEDLQAYGKAEHDILNRIRFIQTVMRNTLRKMTHGNPEHFNWAKPYTSEITQIGFFRKSRSHRGLDTVDIKRLPADYVFKDGDVIRFTHINRLSKKETVVVLPATLLRRDPIAIAQMVRIECRNFAETNAYKERVAKNAEIDEAKKRLEALEKDLFSLQTRKPMKSKSVKKSDRKVPKVA